MVFLIAGAFLTVMLAWSIATFAKSVPTRVYLIPSNSMSPTIKAGDRVGVQDRSHPLPARGEIWVFLQPSPGSKPSITLVKRVIGLPGESLEVASGKVIVDGRALDEPYLSGPISYTMPPIKLGPDEFFMMGDSRNSSQDSHVWGPVPRDHLIGPVTLRFWPLQKVGGL